MLNLHCWGKQYTWKLYFLIFKNSSIQKHLQKIRLHCRAGSQKPLLFSCNLIDWDFPALVYLDWYIRDTDKLVLKSSSKFSSGILQDCDINTLEWGHSSQLQESSTHTVWPAGLKTVACFAFFDLKKRVFCLEAGTLWQTTLPKNMNGFRNKELGSLSNTCFGSKL